MLSISPIYASILIALIIFLAYRVTSFRQKETIDLGDEGCSKQMSCAIRAHANAVENIPVSLILLIVMELNNLTPWMLHSFGAILVFARFYHAWGLSRDAGASRGRYFGTLFTWLCILTMVVVNLLLVLSR